MDTILCRDIFTAPHFLKQLFMGKYTVWIRREQAKERKFLACETQFLFMNIDSMIAFVDNYIPLQAAIRHMSVLTVPSRKTPYQRIAACKTFPDIFGLWIYSSAPASIAAIFSTPSYFSLITRTGACVSLRISFSW